MANLENLFSTVKTSFNAPHEVSLRIKEQHEGLSKPERRMLQFLPQKCCILDIGCATGRASIALAKEGHVVTGIDVAERLIEEARVNAAEQELTITYQVCDPATLPFPNEVFDAVLMLKTYCYVPKRRNRVAWLNEIARVLKPESWLFLVQYSIDGILDNYDSIHEENQQRFSDDILETLEEGDGFSTHEIPTFIHYFMEADLTDELVTAPFQIVDSFREDTLCHYVLKSRLG
ncbi:MAG: class I SAM-dependent methyltransferase [Candidatus Poribacteria bacterium]|nr:class I SAM-dependent methyltransferase [Candidatus Poribacteria bacterium]MDD9972944.1 class I SAM-dependent methyltransferase [Candidatus Poribacteria bacterium]MDE0324118.1 class I SAM-dependent methyltransferase [Candidatus Poribacteria bacterium]MDE0468363.1 class I SAM-dependent methyltransferase [Candidatus Poribacteria bacterium]